MFYKGSLPRTLDHKQRLQDVPQRTLQILWNEKKPRQRPFDGFNPTNETNARQQHWSECSGTAVQSCTSTCWLGCGSAFALGISSGGLGHRQGWFSSLTCTGKSFGLQGSAKSKLLFSIMSSNCVALVFCLFLFFFASFTVC